MIFPLLALENKMPSETYLFEARCVSKGEDGGGHSTLAPILFRGSHAWRVALSLEWRFLEVIAPLPHVYREKRIA